MCIVLRLYTYILPNMNTVYRYIYLYVWNIQWDPLAQENDFWFSPEMPHPNSKLLLWTVNQTGILPWFNHEVEWDFMYLIGIYYSVIKR